MAGGTRDLSRWSPTARGRDGTAAIDARSGEVTATSIRLIQAISKIKFQPCRSDRKRRWASFRSRLRRSEHSPFRSERKTTPDLFDFPSDSERRNHENGSGILRALVERESWAHRIRTDDCIGRCSVPEDVILCTKSQATPYEDSPGASFTGTPLCCGTENCGTNSPATALEPQRAPSGHDWKRGG